MQPPARQSAPAPPGRSALVRALAAAGAAALTVVVTLWAVPASSAASTGFVRLAHFSPDTQQVDVYLSSFSSPGKPTVFRGVGYGVLSRYAQLPVGRYTVSMRPAGAPAGSPPVITTDVRVEPGKAYTVAGLGRNASLALRVLGDDLTAPPAGNAKLRLIAAAAQAPVLTVAESGRSPLVERARFATASPYVTLPAGSRSLSFTTAGAAGPLTSTRLHAAPGGVYSLVVLDGGPGRVKVLVSNDAQSAAAAPVGGVETGLGGTAPAAQGWRDRTRVALFGLALLLGGGSALAVRAAQARQRVPS